MYGLPDPKAAVAATLMLAVSLTAAFVSPAAAQTAAPAAKEKAKAKVTAPARLDLNKATAEELQAGLPAVGEVTAGKIVSGRPYTSVDDLARAGVPARTIEQIRALVTVSATPTPRTKAAAKADAPATPAARVDLNTATAEQLETLSGIGPASAREIIAARPFTSVDDLERVKGLGKVRIAAIRDRVTLTAPTPTPAKGETMTKAATQAAAANPATAVTKNTPKARAATSPVPGRVVNLNTASREELDSLPGIGPVKAEAILEYRKTTPFKTKEDIMKVKGIKDGEFSKIKNLITVD